MKYRITKAGDVKLRIPGNNEDYQKDTRPDPVDKEFAFKRKTIRRRKPKVSTALKMGMMA